MSQPNIKGDNFVEIENPYRIYDFESGDWFYHEEVIERIKKIFAPVRKNKIVLLQGNPGTGKSGTLKKIESSPELLGENYIPIYLDTKKYSGLDIEALSFTLYKDIIEKLIKKGYDIPRPNYFKERHRKGGIIGTLELVLLAIASNLKKHEILVVIFDELDDFLEHADVETVSGFISYAANIDLSWDKYGFILAGDRKLLDLTLNETIRSLLKTAETIDMKEILAEDNIRHLIVEPAKGRLVYADEAVEKILHYSGGNLFFQQLICYHIVEYLNNEEQDFCTHKHVETVIGQILDSSQEDFLFFWENKFSMKARIVASALVDDRIMEKESDFYSIKQGTILDDSLGTDLFPEIEKLTNYGYLNPINGRQFPGFPFKIVIFGKWIKKEHPFIRTVMQNIDAVASRIDLEFIIEEIENTLARDLMPFDKETILKISGEWCSLLKIIVKERTNIRKDQLEIFFKSFFNHLDLTFKDARRKENHFLIDIKALKIGLLEEALCFVQDRPELSKDDIAYIERQTGNFAREAQKRLTFFFYFRKLEKVEELVKKRYLNLIAIDENDFKKIILSDRPQEAARRVILSKISLERVSPYKIAGPAETTFYGRKDYIDRISNNPGTSFAVVGARKIGKSSLLLKVKENPPPGVTYVPLNLDYQFSNTNSYRTFFKSLQSEMETKFEQKIDFGSFFPGAPLSKFQKVIKELFEKGNRIVFIFDEIDGLIAFDRKNDFKLLRLFRTMSQEKQCQFVFAGFEELFLSKRDMKHPLYNFGEEIPLDPLDKESSLALITEPMESVGVRYKNDLDREAILDYTGCHPNLLQFFCKKLVENVEKKRMLGDQRTIFKEDIEDLYDSEYEKYIMDEVYMFYHLDNIDQLILMVLLEDRISRKTFSASTISDKLAAENVHISMSNLMQHLRELSMRFILRNKERDIYEFALPGFPDILRKWTDEFYKNKIKLEIKKNAL